MLLIYFILGLIVALILIAILSPSSYVVEKNITINRPVSEVYGKVADLNNFRKWNPWQQTEPGAASEITGSPDTIGHKYSWEGKKIGIGSFTLANRVTNQSIHFQLEFLKPWKSKADDSWTFSENAGATLVNWRNSGELPFPVARLMGPIIKKQLNHQFEAGLLNLKKLCEG
jgi:hypothetical protein